MEKVIYSLTFIGLCIANIFAEYNQKDTTFHNLFISVRRSTCFRLFFRPLSASRNSTTASGYVRTILPLAASMCRIELLMMDGKTV